MMKPILRSLSIFAITLLAVATTPALATKDVVFAVASTFTTTDPYDANDTLSQAMAKSFYEGLFGFDKDMKMIPVLADSYTVSKDGLVYTIKLKRGIKFQDGTDFNAEAVKVNFDRVSNPDNHLKRYGLYSVIARTDAVDAYTARITLKEPFSAFINDLAHPAGVMISPAALEKWGSKDIAFHPVGTGPFKFVEWKQPDYLKVAEVRRLLAQGLPEGRFNHLAFGGRQQLARGADADRRGPVHLPGALRARRRAEIETRNRGRRGAVDRAALPVDEHAAEAFRQSKGARGDRLRDQQAGAGQSRVQRLRRPCRRRRARCRRVRHQARPMALRRREGKEAPRRGGLSEWLRDRAVVGLQLQHSRRRSCEFLQQQLQQVGIRTKITLLEAGQRVEKVESWQDPKTAPVRLYYVGWSTSTGEADWALRPLLYGDSWPPTSFNTAYYKNDRVDADIKGALATTDKAQKARLYRDAQERIWKDAPWAPLVTEQLLSAHSKNLSGVYVMPDASFNFTDVDLK